MARHVSKVLGLLLGLVACGEGKKGPPPPPPTVYVGIVTRRDVPLYVEAVGALDGYDNAEIRARVRGHLRAQSYQDGSFVKSGQTLFTIQAAQDATSLTAAPAAPARAPVNP